MKHIFFDLDRTLWDFDNNSRLTLKKIFKEFKLSENYALKEESFISKYEKINRSFWARYAKGEIQRESLRVDRFYNTLRDFGIEDNVLASKIATFYLAECPKNEVLMPNAREVLDHLREKYPLHIITNGFTASQEIKIRSSRLESYFASVVTSDMAQAQKPSTQIFNMAWEKAGKPDKAKCFYIGDDWNADVRGATQFGFTPIWYSSEYRRTKVKQVSDLADLIPLLDN